MSILHNKWLYAALGGLTIVGIFILLSIYAFHAMEDSFKTKAADNLKTIYTAEEQYRQSFPERGYSHALRELGSPANGCPTSTLPPPTSACLIDFALANASSPATAKSGYFYTYATGPSNEKGIIESYTVHEDPAIPRPDTPYFFIDETGVQRIERGKPAGKNSPVKKDDEY